MFQDQDTNELYWLIIGGPLLLGGAVFGWLSGFDTGTRQATGWLIDHNVLVTGQEALIPIGEAGLDLPRIVFAASLLVLLLMVTLALRKPSRA